MDRPRSARMEEWRSRGRVPFLAQTRACWPRGKFRMDTRRLAFVESLNGFKDFRPGKFTRDDEIIVNHCGLERLFIQVRSECVTLCSGELTRVCSYPPKFVLKSQDPRFHGVFIESELLIPVCICEDLNPILSSVSLRGPYHRSSKL